MTWNIATLGEYTTTQKGFAFKSQWFTAEGRAVVKVSDFTSESISGTAVSRMDTKQAAEYERYALQTGDVVVQTVGSWPNNPASVVGKAVRVPNELNGSLLNQNAVRLDPVNLDKRLPFLPFAQQIVQ